MPVPVRPNDLNKRKCFNFKYCFWLSILIIIVVFVVIVLVFVWLDSKVKNLKELEIGLLTASNFNLSSRPNQISADWNIIMNFQTMANRGYFNFKRTKVSLYYDDRRIMLKEFRSFTLSSKHQPMHFGREFTGSSGYIDDSDFRNVARDVTAGNVKFNVVFQASVRKTFVKGWRLDEAQWVDFAGYCPNVELFFGSPNVSKARMLNGSNKCQLHRKDLSYDHRYDGTYSEDIYGHINPLCFDTNGGGRICV
ncbi:hypothetical protein POM88_034931 [Heracleum sosnowskyi]|uniref:Uncharacterized protein n=1 Tax=Heracleum sosnowskyi TaxID=360622 RepID=A0AAD8MDM2_9APIA|nr:hypothetical protein POM88_034931 [Heracleum sosnowskyi]